MFRSIMLLALLTLFATRSASASYTEAHAVGVDAHVTVERDGRISVTYVLAYRVAAGALRTIAVTGFEDDWRFNPTSKVTSPDGHVFGATVSRDPKGVLHVTVDDAKGLKRGDYRFELVYESTLGPRVIRDGAFDRVRFALPPLHEGIDGARVVLDFAAAPTEPTPVTDGDMAADLATLRRSTDHDELELVRPHVPKGESAAFFVRVDPKALGQVDVPHGSTPVSASAVVTARPSMSAAILAALCALVVFALGLTKARVLGEAVVGLLPGPGSLRALAAGLAFGAAVLVETQGHDILGAGLVAAALPLLAWRVASPKPRPSGRGTWLVVSPAEAFATCRAPADFLDATTRVGAALLTIAVLAVALACWLARTSGSLPYWIAIDAFVLVPVFVTGTMRQMPPNARREAMALGPIARALASYDELRVSPLISSASNEMRLIVSPRLAMTGVRAIEVGVAWERAGGAFLPSFDVLVRVQDDSFAAAKMTAGFATKRALPGRKPDERVYRFEPEWPTRASLTSLVLDLEGALRDRRLTLAKPPMQHAGERRVPPKRAATRGASLA